MKQFFKGALMVFLLTIGGYCAKAAVVLSETHTNASCYGGTNGTIDITATGNAPFVFLWNDLAVSEDRTGLAAGTYTVVVIDALSTSDTLSITINEPTQIVAAKAITPVSCGGGNDGAIDLTITGGTPGYSILWQDAATTEDRTNITAFHYHFVVTDANGCQMNDSANVTQPMGMVPSIAVTDANCNANNGDIDLTVQYGYPPYTYVWGDGPTTEDRNSLNIGTYNVTVTDNIACTVSMTATVNQANTPMNINHTQVNAACFGSATGSINITSVVGAPGPFTYNWSNTLTTQTISTLTAGSYTVTVTSANSCTATKTISVTEPALLTVNTTAIQPTCNTSNNGAITTSVSGGTTGYNYNWGSGFTTQNRFSLGAGTYTVTVTDNRGCTASSSQTITPPAAVSVVATPTQLNCMGGSTGAINTTVTGGTGTYSYWWGAGVTSANRTGLAAGTYNVTVNDGNGCSATASAVISPYVPMTASSTQVNNSCYGDSSASINLTVNNGLAPYTYSWSNSATSEDIANLKADTYTVVITDNHSCTISRNMNITQPAFPIYLNATVTDATCGGYTDGAISISPANAAAPSTYAWNDGITAQNRTGLGAGNYSVTLTDNAGCQVNGSYTINEPDAIILMPVTSDVTCNGASTGGINLTVMGGNAPFTYAWNDAAATQHRTSISAGTYSVTVTDNHSCSTSISETIYEPTAITAIASVTNLTCFGAANGAISLNVSGGSGSHSFQWNDAATTSNRTGLAAGTYTVTITDAASCSTTLSSTITQPAAIAIAASTTNATCNNASDGSISLSVSGGSLLYSFNWSDGAIAQTRTNLNAGTYTVSVYDNNMCSATSSVTITQPAPIAITSTKTDATCNTGGTITITVTGGTGARTYLWSNGATTQNITNLSPAIYTVTATYTNTGCSATASETIIGTAPLAISYTKVDNTACFGDSTGLIDVTVTGGTVPYTYMWNNGATAEDRNTLRAGTYRVTVTDASNCSASVAIVITHPTQLTIFVAKTNVSCSSTTDGSINITPVGATPPYTFLWSNGQTTEDISALPVAIYTVTVTDNNGCTARVNSNVQQPSTIVVDATKTNVSCNGGNDGSIDITATGGTGNFKYQWNIAPPSTSLSNLSANTYVVTVTDTVSTCRTIKSITVTQPAPLQTITSITDVNCFGLNNGTVSTNPFGGTAPYYYNWSNGVTTASNSNIAAGTYTLAITDTNGCSITGSATVNQPAPITPTVSVNNTCFETNNGAVNISVTGGIGSNYTYSWSNGDSLQNLSGLTDGTYSVTVKDNANCTAAANATVNRFAELVINESHNNVNCFGAATGVIQVTPQGGAGHYSFNWNNSGTSNLLNNITAGTYLVTVTDGGGCTAQKAITITQPAAISLTEQHTNYACSSNPGQIDVTVAGGTPPYFYRWNDNANSEDRSMVTAGAYEITVSDYNSCRSVMQVNVTTAPALVLTTSATTPSCYGYSNGAISTNVSGGTLPYSYLWANGETNRDLQGIAAGTYAILVTDANNCSATQAIALTQPQGISLSKTITDARCYNATNGAIDITTANGTAPYTYVWNNTQTTEDLNSVPAGNYAVTITDAANCSIVFSEMKVEQPGELSLSADIIPAGCFTSSAHGAIDITVNGGSAPFAYSWDNGANSQDIANLTAGNYFVAVTDANGCLATKANTISLSPAIDIVATTKNTACSQVTTGTVELTINGGVPEFTFDWSTGANTQNITELPAGTYTVTVSDMSHCSAQANFTIDTDYELTARATTNIESLVSGQSAELSALTNVDNGNVYTWSSTEEVKCSSCAVTAIKPSATAAYTLNVTDVNGCSATDIVTVEVKQIAEVFIPNVFTPNNDANNDLFKIYGDMSTIALLDIKIFNRWGEKVYETNDIEFAWDGSYKGEIVDRGVYTYTLKIVYVNGVANDLYTGSITVLR